MKDVPKETACDVAVPHTAAMGWPGLALVVDRDGGITASNGRNDALESILRERPELLAYELFQPSTESETARPAFIAVPRDKGRQSLELTILPLRQGGNLVLVRDVTLEENLRAALMESRQRYKDFVEISNDFAWETDEQGRFVFVSPRGALGYSPDDLVGRDPDQFLITMPTEASSSPFATEISVEGAEVWMRTAQGTRACLILAAAPLLGPDGTWQGARGVCRDVTELYLRDTALARARNHERLLTHIVRTFRDEVNPDRMLTVAASALLSGFGADGCQIFGAKPEVESHGTEPDPVFVQPILVLEAAIGEGGDEDGVLARVDLARAEALGPDHFTMDGRVAMAAATHFRQRVNGAVCLWRDRSRGEWNDEERKLFADILLQIGVANEQVANHRCILALSRTDPLTGLFNRRAFYGELERRFLRQVHENKPAALIFVDLDNFKHVNDIHGHRVGDEALLKVRDLMLAHTRPVDLVARLGGDEFAMWIEGADRAIAESRSIALLNSAQSLVPYSGSSEHPLHMSLGVAIYDPTRPENFQDLLHRADNAMYTAKRDGKGICRFASPPETGP
ncbi:MAG: diguanylate cyclase domain-containing protein [Alphaproteobacteria bacterium]